jgi:hypothetical protein
MSRGNNIWFLDYRILTIPALNIRAVFRRGNVPNISVTFGKDSYLEPLKHNDASRGISQYLQEKKEAVQ